MSETERIVPQLTDQNEFYWESGEDGKLRFQKCNDCAGLTYPPQQVCSHCRSLDLEVTAVSGKARLIGFTFNQRFGMPGLPAPFTFVQVAIEEDDRVRLTSRLVDAEHTDLTLGQQMQVQFEHKRLLQL